MSSLLSFPTASIVSLHLKKGHASMGTRIGLQLLSGVSGKPLSIGFNVDHGNGSNNLQAGNKFE